VAVEELVIFNTGKKILFFILVSFIFCMAAYAEQAVPQLTPENTTKIFSLGRSVGSSYYHLIDLCDKAGKKPFVEIQQDYSITFQNLNVIDIILNDLNIDGKSREDLNKLRINFYNALKNQDLNETQIAFVRDMFVVFYENLAQDVLTRNYAEGSWLLSLGFYTSFQLESLNSPAEEKILLSGFSKIYDARLIQVPENVDNSLLTVNNLDKISVTQTELAGLRTNLVNITEYFTNYPCDFAGIWQGILINPENEKHDIRLTVNKDLTAVMNIAGIAEDVTISDIRIVNNYFTFMFKPFGTEKLYLKFDAKLSENIFTGEITDVLGAKGHWVLAKTDNNYVLNEDKLDTMVSYIAEIERKLTEIPINNVQTVEPVSEIIETVNEITLPALEETINTNKKGFWQGIKTFFQNLNDFVLFNKN